MVEPGDTKTNFTDQRVFVSHTNVESVYKERFDKSIQYMAKAEAEGPGPEIIVRAVEKIISKKNPPVRITPGIQYKLIVFLKRILPARMVLAIVGKLYAS
jgi:short-subunit dehydrogenase